MFSTLLSYVNPINPLMNISNFFIANKMYSIPLFSAGLYAGFYYLAKTRYKYYLHSWEYDGDVSHLVSYTSSTIHASTMSIFNGLYLFDLIDRPLLNCIYLYGIGYMGADLAIIYYDKKFRKEAINYTFHHSIAIASEIAMINYVLPYYSNVYVPIMFMAEINVPIMNYCWYLIHTGRQNTKLFKIAGGLNLLLYFIFRICNFTYMYYKLYSINNTLSLFPMTFITVLNYFWFYKLVKRSLCNKKDGKKTEELSVSSYDNNIINNIIKNRFGFKNRF